MFFFRSAGNWLPSDIQRPEDRNASTEPTVTLSPNPASTNLKLDFHSSVTAGVIPFQIVSATGQIMVEKQQQISVGNNDISFDIGSLPSGIYWLVAPQIGVPAKAWVKE